MNQHTSPVPYPGGPVHFYSFDAPEGTVLFDVGAPTEESVAVLARAVDFSHLDTVFITHTHLDHIGGIRPVLERTETDIVMSSFDLRGLAMDRDERVEPVVAIMADLGFPPEVQDGVRKGWHGIVDRLPKIDAGRVKTLEEAEGEMERLGVRAVPCPGHSQSDIVYLMGDTEAVSGDVMLQGVFQTPLIDAELDTGRRFDNYGAWCATVRRISAMKGRRFLPGHGPVITDPAALIAFYIGKLAKRADAVRATETGSVFDTVETFMGKGDARREPFKAYLRAGEIMFIRDARTRPDILVAALDDLGITNRLSRELEQLLG